MDVNTIMQIIGSLGFPIVACAALFWQNTKTNEQHKEEMDKMREALDNNTQALIRLAAKIGEEE